MTPTSTRELSAAEKRVLEEIFQKGWGTGAWPTFGEIDNPLDREDIDAQDVIDSLGPDYVRRDGAGSPIQPNETLRLTFRAAIETSGGALVQSLFLSTLEYLVECQRNFVPTSDFPQLSVSQDDVAQFLSQSGRPLEVASVLSRNLGLILCEERNIHSGFTHGSPTRMWVMTVGRQIRIYRGVVTLAAYLERNPLRNSLEATLQFGQALVAQAEVTPAIAVDPRKVFVVHGRDAEAKQAVLEYLTALGLDGFDWGEPVSATGSGTPFTGNIVDEAFKLAHAVIVLLTPDELAMLHPDLYEGRDKVADRELSSQVRPNVLFEAGMAFAHHPKNTIIVEIGLTRSFSDIEGRNTVRIDTNPNALADLARRLKDAGCPVDRDAGDWDNFERFSSLSALTRVLPPSLGDPIVTRLMTQQGSEIDDN